MSLIDFKAILAGASMLGITIATNTLEQNSQPQPRPVNPPARPLNPQPTPTSPPAHPTNPQPNTVPQSPPDPNLTNPQNTNPTNTNPQINPADLNNPAIVDPALVRNGSPFAFVAADGHSRFNENARQLVNWENTLEKNRQDLLRRLGEARQLPPEKQTAALMDLMQQVLMSQEQLQKYLVRARSTWTGDIEMNSPSVTHPLPPTQTTQPATSRK